MGFYDSLPPSFGSQVISKGSGEALKKFDFGNKIDSSLTGKLGFDAAGQFDSVAESLTGTGALAGGGGWTFICAPEDVSWSVANAASRIDIFGTNNPPVVAGTKGMRDLNLGNALVEGFTRKVTIEGKIAALEKLTEYSLNSTDGFVSVPVYQVWANAKSYGGPQAFFIIKDINVKETMRDLQGNATRAYVDISLMQVPAYQVNSGRDQAGKVTAGGAALQQSVAAQANAAVTGATGAAATAAGAKPSSGPGAGGPAAPAKPGSTVTSALPTQALN